MPTLDEATLLELVLELEALELDALVGALGDQDEARRLAVLAELDRREGE